MGKDISLKSYDLDTEFHFGKFNGKTLQEVLEIDSGYIGWCINNLDSFFIEEEVILKIGELKYGLWLSQFSKNILEAKGVKWKLQQVIATENLQTKVEKTTYGQYSGTYAQEVEGYSDEFINDALDGDADSSWNLD